jgi:hypothetical protein
LFIRAKKNNLGAFAAPIVHKHHGHHADGEGAGDNDVGNDGNDDDEDGDDDDGEDGDNGFAALSLLSGDTVRWLNKRKVVKGPRAHMYRYHTTLANALPYRPVFSGLDTAGEGDIELTDIEEVIRKVRCPGTVFTCSSLLVRSRPRAFPHSSLSLSFSATAVHTQARGAAALRQPQSHPTGSNPPPFHHIPLYPTSQFHLTSPPLFTSLSSSSLLSAAAQFFREMDTDGGGTVDFGEFAIGAFLCVCIAVTAGSDIQDALIQSYHTPRFPSPLSPASLSLLHVTYLLPGMTNCPGGRGSNSVIRLQEAFMKYVSI